MSDIDSSKLTVIYRYVSAKLFSPASKIYTGFGRSAEQIEIKTVIANNAAYFHRQPAITEHKHKVS